MKEIVRLRAESPYVEGRARAPSTRVIQGSRVSEAVIRQSQAGTSFRTINRPRR